MVLMLVRDLGIKSFTSASVFLLAAAVISRQAAPGRELLPVLRAVQGVAPGHNDAMGIPVGIYWTQTA